MGDQLAWKRDVRLPDRKARRVFYIVIAIALLGWTAALALFLAQGRHTVHVDRPHNPHRNDYPTDHGKKVELDHVLRGDYYARHGEIDWIDGPKGEDGMLLERTRGAYGALPRCGRCEIPWREHGVAEETLNDAHECM